MTHAPGSQAGRTHVVYFSTYCGAFTFKMTEEYTQDCTSFEEGQFHADNTVSQASEMAEQSDTEAHQSVDHINASKNVNDDRKIFVGGLSWETTLKDLREYFEKYGTVLDCNLKTDPTTNRSRGFGFVMFEESAAVDRVLAESSHMLHGRNIDPKRAKARGTKEPVMKIFVGGLDPSTPEEDVRSHFEKFGKVAEVELPFDKAKQQRRGFCFVTFETEEAADGACAETKQEIAEGKTVDVRKATAKTDKFGGGAGGYGGGGGRGRYGRGRGGGGNNYDQGNGWGYDNYDYSNYYGNNYDYSNYYNMGYGNYDYSGYYNQGWGNYNYQGYEGNNYSGQNTSSGGSTGGGGKMKSNGNNKYQPY